MKKILALLLFLCGTAHAQVPWSVIMQVEDGSNTFNRTYFVGPPSQDALFKYNVSTDIPEMLNLGTAGASVIAAATAADARTAINAFPVPSGNTGQYVRGDGTLANLPAFNFSQPAAKSISVSTDFQAADPSKPAIITPSYACQNSTTVLAASGCTLQVRMGTGALTCSTGTIVYTQSLTVALGLLITQNSTNPVQINMPTGGHAIICATTGTFTIVAVEQSIG